MIAYGFIADGVARDLAIAARLGATCVEIFPNWKAYPDPAPLRREVAEAGLTIHSAHGCWGGQSIAARRVDLGSTDRAVRASSLDDVRRCVDWLASAGGRCLVVHPGGLSAEEEAAARRDVLVASLGDLADHAEGTGVVVCVENMPPGVRPGSRMFELAGIVAEVGRPEVALALDTGHAHLVASAASETRAAGARLVTTHVHDNDGRKDAHLVPGQGTVDWGAWAEALDEIDYRGPVMLECIRALRDDPSAIDAPLIRRLALLCGNA